jgi:hypothetical protein
MTKLTDVGVLLSATTGLTLDDIFWEAAADTVEEQNIRRTANLIKMNDFLVGKSDIVLEVKDEKSNPV